MQRTVTHIVNLSLFQHVPLLDSNHLHVFPNLPVIKGPRPHYIPINHKPPHLKPLSTIQNPLLIMSEGTFHLRNIWDTTPYLHYLHNGIAFVDSSPHMHHIHTLPQQPWRIILFCLSVYSVLFQSFPSHSSQLYATARGHYHVWAVEAHRRTADEALY